MHRLELDRIGDILTYFKDLFAQEAPRKVKMNNLSVHFEKGVNCLEKFLDALRPPSEIYDCIEGDAEGSETDCSLQLVEYLGQLEGLERAIREVELLEDHVGVQVFCEHLDLPVLAELDARKPQFYQVSIESDTAE